MTQIFAHRGAVSFATENTLKAVEKALELKVDGIELDIQKTKDEKLIVFHDYILNFKTNTKGMVYKKTLEQLKEVELHDGKIPTLEEVLELVNGRCVLNLEIKSKNAVYSIVQAVEHYKIVDKVILSSYYKNAVKKVKEKNPEIATAIITTPFIPKKPLNCLKLYKSDALHIPQHKVTEKIIKDLHGEGFQVRSFPWRNKTTSMELFEKLKGYNIDGVIMNNPEEVL